MSIKNKDANPFPAEQTAKPSLLRGAVRRVGEEATWQFVQKPAMEVDMARRAARGEFDPPREVMEQDVTTGDIYRNGELIERGNPTETLDETTTIAQIPTITLPPQNKPSR